MGVYEISNNKKLKSDHSHVLKKSASSDDISGKNNSTIIITCILLITFFVFSNSLSNGFVINWDDDGYIINNPLIKNLSLESIKNIFTAPHLDNYHPLTTLSNAIELKFFGFDPKPYHFINLVLHLLNTFLVFRFVKLLSLRIEVAAITALFFGIHPMHVESVSWISERKDVLYAFFFLGSLICYLKYLNDKKAVFMAASILLFLLSLLSKPAAVILPLVLLLLDYYSGRSISVKIVMEKIPFFVLALLFGVIAMRIQQDSGSTSMVSAFALYDRIFLASYALVYYLLKLLIPTGLSAVHLYPENIDGRLPLEYYIAPLIIILVAWIIYRTKEHRRMLVFGILFFLTTIILVIQLTPVGRAIVAERYTYIPYIGLFFIIGHFYCLIKDNKIVIARKIKPYLLPAFAGYTFVFLVMTWNRNKAWKDSNSLFSEAIETDPDNYFAYYARAVGKGLIGDTNGAIKDYDEVVRIRPTYANGFYSRGTLKEKVNAADAIADYTEAIRQDPKYDKAFYNRGNLKINSRDYQGAIADYTETIRINSKNAEAYCNRGVAKYNLGNNKEAIEDYNEAIRLDPKLTNAYANRALTKFTIGDITQACNDWKMAQKYGSTDASKMIEQYCK